MNRLTLHIVGLVAVVFLLWPAATQLLGVIEMVERPTVATRLPLHQPAADGDLAITRFAPGSLETFSQTTTRPIFFEGRRYPAREVASAPPPPPRPAPSASPVVAPQPVIIPIVGLKLKGLQLGGGTSRALIEAPSQPATWVTVGGKVQAWTIDAIQRDGVLLRQNGQTAKLNLYDPPQSK